jgi:hypothetical protein
MLVPAILHIGNVSELGSAPAVLYCVSTSPLLAMPPRGVISVSARAPRDRGLAARDRGLAADRATGIGPGAAARRSRGAVASGGMIDAPPALRRGPWCAESGLTKALAAGRFTFCNRTVRPAVMASAMGHKRPS